MAQTISEAPITKLVAITPNDGADLAAATRAVWVGGAGNLRVIAADDATDVTLSGVPAGTLLPIRVKKVFATSTTATLIVGLS